MSKAAIVLGNDRRDGIIATSKCKEAENGYNG